MLIQTCAICRLPREVLEEIVVGIVDDGPKDLLPLLYTCQQLYHTLKFANRNSNDLYARVFSILFNTGAPFRRFGPRILRPSSRAAQLRKQSDTLRFIRRRNIYAHDIEEHFWTAFIMLAESDGDNQIRLENAGLADFVDDFVRTRLWEGRSLYGGWPPENTINSLALWLMWLLTTEEKLAAETTVNRYNIINLVMPYVELAFRYPAFLAPDNHYYFPLPEEFQEQHPRSLVTAHGPWPLYRAQDTIRHRLTHFGKDIVISQPLITVAAKLIYFSRREVVPITMPQHLPMSRQEAIALNRPGPTQDDIREFNAFKQAKLLKRPQLDWRDELTEDQLEIEDSGLWSRTLKAPSAKWDNDWQRWMHCSDIWRMPEDKGVVYTFGSLSGLWQGRMLVASEPTYMALVSTAQMPPIFNVQQDPFITGRPVYMRLREHHCIDPEDPIPVGGLDDGFDDGICNGWFPPFRGYKESQGLLRFMDQDQHETTYETFVEGRPSSHNKSTCRLCINRREIEQEEEEEHARAFASSFRSASDRSGSSLPSSPGSHNDFEDDFREAGLGRDSMDVDEDEDEDDDDEEDYNINTCSGITDIVVTGETDVRHGEAWDPYRYYGRVRTWDGLIALVRVRIDPTTGQADPGHGRMILRGYIVAGQNFVGTWRYWTPDVRDFSMEGPIVLSKRE